MKLVQTDDKQFARDPRSSAVLNIDNAAYQHFQQERERMIHLQHVSAEVGELREELNDIKRLLVQLVNGKRND